MLQPAELATRPHADDDVVVARLDLAKDPCASGAAR
jgi:hypothetical protein